LLPLNTNRTRKSHTTRLSTTPSNTKDLSDVLHRAAPGIETARSSLGVIEPYLRGAFGLGKILFNGDFRIAKSHQT
jgi:hypothetical protein